MKTQKAMIYQINSELRTNLFKGIFTLILMAILSSLMTLLLGSPALSIMVKSSDSFILVMLAGIWILFCAAVIYIFEYGFFVIMYLIYIGKPVVIGHLFTGFRDFKRAIKVGLIFVALYTVCLMLLLGLCFLLVNLKIVPDTFFNIESLLPVLLIFSLIYFALVTLRFGFVWLELYSDTTITVLQAIKKSKTYVYKSFWSLIFFVLRSTGWFGLMAILGLILILILPLNSTETHIILETLFNLGRFIYTAGLYVSYIRMAMAFGAWFDNKNVPDIVELPPIKIE